MSAMGHMTGTVLIGQKISGLARKSRHGEARDLTVATGRIVIQASVCVHTAVLRVNESAP
jgi:hypothetical protein